MIRFELKGQKEVEVEKDVVVQARVFKSFQGSLCLQLKGEHTFDKHWETVFYIKDDGTARSDKFGALIQNDLKRIFKKGE